MSTPLETRALRTDRGPLALSALGFGGAPLGNLYAPLSEAQAADALEAAWEAGIRVFDTAPLYGYGLSEERFGRVLPDKPRDELIVSTKVGRVLVDCAPDEVSNDLFINTPARTFRYDYSRDGVMRSVEDSLRRLRLERIDILLVHDIDIWTHGSEEAADRRIRELFDGGGYRALDELRASGAVRAIGAGVNEAEICFKLMAEGRFDCFLLAGRYSLLEQAALDTLLPTCEREDVGIILGGPYNSGILATGAVDGARYNYQPAPPAILDRVRRIERVCRDHGVRLVEAALQFPLAHPAVKTVIPGAISREQVGENLSVLRAPLPASLWADLKREGLLRPDAPVPAAPH